MHLGYADTDLTAAVTAPKLDPRDVARAVVDGIAAEPHRGAGGRRQPAFQAGRRRSGRRAVPPRGGRPLSWTEDTRSAGPPTIRELTASTTVAVTLAPWHPRPWTASRRCRPTSRLGPCADCGRRERPTAPRVAPVGCRRWRRSLFGTGGLRILASAVGGLALYAAFAPSTRWWLAIVGFALFGLALAGRSWKAGLGLGLLFGLTFYLPLLTFTNVYVGNLPWIALAVAEALLTAPVGRAGRRGVPAAAGLAGLGGGRLDHRRGAARPVPVRRLPLGRRRVLAGRRAAAAGGVAAGRDGARLSHRAGRVRAGGTGPRARRAAPSAAVRGRARRDRAC